MSEFATIKPKFLHPRLEALIEAMARGESKTFLPFWGPIPSHRKIVAKGCLCQWWVSPFNVSGDEYYTAEHYMMAEKARLFGDDQVLARILQSRDPSEAQYLGRQVQGYQEQRWRERRYAIVVAGNLHKFSQHRELRDYLTSTGDTVLVSANPTDSVWSIGYDEDHPNVCHPERWRGRNLLGFALMEVREQLRGG